MAVEDPIAYNVYMQLLSTSAQTEISTYKSLLEVLKKRHDFFHETGCRISDHGLETMYAADFTMAQLEESFTKIRKGNRLSDEEIHRFKSATLHFVCEWNAERNWVQQFHIGAIRNNNSRLLQRLGADAGVDSIGDWSVAQAM